MIHKAQSLARRLFVGSGVTGVYPDYATALAAVPKRRTAREATSESAPIYPYLLDFTKISDFAALFYLNQLIEPGQRIFDFGGNMGVLYYNYQRRWTAPANVEWTVCDLPQVIAAGRELAKTRPSPGLTFTSRLEDAAGANLFLTSGTLQYVPETLPELLAKLGDAKPRYLLINRTALWDRPSFVTLQTLGDLVLPYRIQNRGEFLAGLTAQGYQLRDTWDCPESRINVRWHLRHRVKHYVGFLLKRV